MQLINIPFKHMSKQHGEYLDVSIYHESSGLLHGATETIKTNYHLNKRCALQIEKEIHDRWRKETFCPLWFFISILRVCYVCRVVQFLKFHSRLLSTSDWFALQPTHLMFSHKYLLSKALIPALRSCCSRQGCIVDRVIVKHVTFVDISFHQESFTPMCALSHRYSHLQRCAPWELTVSLIFLRRQPRAPLCLICLTGLRSSTFCK